MNNKNNMHISKTLTSSASLKLFHLFSPLYSFHFFPLNDIRGPQERLELPTGAAMTELPKLISFIFK